MYKNAIHGEPLDCHTSSFTSDGLQKRYVYAFLFKQQKPNNTTPYFIYFLYLEILIFLHLKLYSSPVHFGTWWAVKDTPGPSLKSVKGRILGPYLKGVF